MKKFLKICGVLLALLVLVIAVIPFVIDVNKYRPQLIAEVEKNIHGKVNLNKIELHLWTGLGLRLTDVVVNPILENGKIDEPALQVGEVKIRIPWHRVLFSPVINIAIIKPVILAHTTAQGNLNFKLLFGATQTSSSVSGNESSSGSNAATNPSAGGNSGSAQGKSGDEAIPEILQNASVNLSIVDGVIQYKTKLESATLEKFNFNIQNLSPTKEMTLRSSISVLMKSKDPKWSVSGDVSLSMNLLPKLVDGKFNHVFVTGELNLGGLGINYPPILNKNAGSALSFGIEGKGTRSQFELKHLGFKTKKSLLSLHGLVKDLGATEPNFDLDLEINPLQLDEATTWISGAGKASGSVVMNGKIRGTPSRPNVSMDLKVDAKNIHPEGVKETIDQLTIAMNLAFSGKKVGEEMIPITLNLDTPQFAVVMGEHNLSGNLQVAGDSDSMVLKMKATSPKFNLDSFSGADLGSNGANGAPSAGSSSGTQGSGGSTGGTAGPAEIVVPLPERLAGLDKQLKELRKNKILQKSTGSIDISIKQLRASGMNMENFKFQASLNRLKFALKQFDLDAFKGAIRTSGEFNIQKPDPDYVFKMKIAGVDLDSATKVSAPSLSGLVSGQLHLSGNVQGRGIKWEDLKTTMTGKGDFQIKDGQLSTIPIGKWVAEAAEKIKFIDKYAGQIREKTAKEYGDKIKRFDANVDIKSGVIHMNPAVFEYATGDIGFQGTGTTTFDQDLDFLGTARTAPALLPVPELKGADGRTWIPIKFNGKLNAPKVDYAYTVEQTAAKVVKGKAKQEVKKQAEKLIQDPKVQEAIQKPEVQEGLKKLFGGKKLF